MNPEHIFRAVMTTMTRRDSPVVREGLALGAVAAALLLAAGCTKEAGAEDGKEGEARTRRAVVEPVATGQVSRWLGYVGDLEAEAEIRVFSAVPDRIISLHVAEGDRVKKGDIIATVRADMLTQGVRQALGGLDAARAGRDALADQVERLRRLSGSGAVSSSQLLGVESQFAGAEAQVRQLEALLGQARQRKGDSVVRAPIAGVIGQTFLEVGDFAAPQIPVCTVVAMDRLRVALRVPEADLPHLAVGQPVELRVAVDDGPPLAATVSRIGPVLERVSRTASLEIDLDNADHALRPGLLVRARVLVESRDGVPLVQKSVLTVTAERRDGISLYRAVVSESGVARERLVRIGLEEGARVEVLEGLAPGDLLVVEGQHLLADGDPIAAPAPPAAVRPAGGN